MRGLGFSIHSETLWSTPAPWKHSPYIEAVPVKSTNPNYMIKAFAKVKGTRVRHEIEFSDPRWVAKLRRWLWHGAGHAASAEALATHNRGAALARAEVAARREYECKLDRAQCGGASIIKKLGYVENITPKEVRLESSKAVGLRVELNLLGSPEEVLAKIRKIKDLLWN